MRLTVVVGICTRSTYGLMESCRTQMVLWFLDQAAGPSDIALLMGNASGDTRDVHGLQLVPKGPVFWFPPVDGAEPVVLVRVGAGPHNDIVVQGKHVTETHCVLEVTRSQVKVRDFEHPGETLVNNVVIADGSAVLHLNSRLRLGKQGKTQFVACGLNGKVKPDIVAGDFPGIMRDAHEVYDSGPKISEALGIPARTVYNKLKKFGIVAVALLGGLFWSALGSESSGQGRAVESAPVVAPAAAGAPVVAPVGEPGDVEPGRVGSVTPAVDPARECMNDDRADGNNADSGERLERRTQCEAKAKKAKPSRAGPRGSKRQARRAGATRHEAKATNARSRESKRPKRAAPPRNEDEEAQDAVGASYNEPWQFPGVSHDVQ